MEYFNQFLENEWTEMQYWRKDIDFEWKPVLEKRITAIDLAIIELKEKTDANANVDKEMLNLINNTLESSNRANFTGTFALIMSMIALIVCCACLLLN